jgi:hypothetical protein
MSVASRKSSSLCRTSMPVMVLSARVALSCSIAALSSDD